MLFGKKKADYLEAVVEVARLKRELLRSTYYSGDAGSTYNRVLATYTQGARMAACKVKAEKLEQFLADILLIDPKLSRFETTTGAEGDAVTSWHFAQVHDAAELIRSDKAEVERRDALKAMQEGGE